MSIFNISRKCIRENILFNNFGIYIKYIPKLLKYQPIQ